MTPLLKSLALPGKAGQIFALCAISSALAAALLCARTPKSAEDVPVSYKEDRAPLAASSPVSRQQPQQDQTAATPEKPSHIVGSVSVESTFGDAARRLGVDPQTTATLARAFAYQLDLRRDLRAGDTLSVVMPPPGDASASVEPLAVRLTAKGVAHDLFLHRSLDAKPFYLSLDGKDTRPSFSRFPLQFTRVSSTFSAHRLDPVTHRWQSHDGVDLAAPVGTPVHATARGVVKFIGWQRGYGKVIVLQNPRSYSTVFAHLSRFAKGLRRGSRIKRGAVIGYVGRTGWTTGPHLHYEVHVRSVPKDPLTVALPTQTRLASQDKSRFETNARVLQHVLEGGDDRAGAS
ncbi:M23 family metallopeptidase [Caballeronia sp. AZ10_KS36]|uniref:M23 family metallopeptidase n=1 Tax=Caballeronia sp. AZ10_KS36 TaxID=2921757 RepID=UPI002027F5EA|nr:M23 family metallopeptidase [Caballeronia sp. AZ10_KS36]